MSIITDPSKKWTFSFLLIPYEQNYPVMNVVDSQIQIKITLCDQLSPNDIYIIHSEIKKRTTDQDQKKQQVVPIAQITLKKK
jgi:hypothetical protein